LGVKSFSKIFYGLHNDFQLFWRLIPQAN